MEMSPVARIDATAVHMMRDLRTLLKDRGVTLILSNPSSPVIRGLEKAKALEEIGAANLFVRVHDAALHCLHEIAEEGGEGAEYLARYTDDILGGGSSPVGGDMELTPQGSPSDGEPGDGRV